MCALGKSALELEEAHAKMLLNLHEGLERKITNRCGDTENQTTDWENENVSVLAFLLEGQDPMQYFVAGPTCNAKIISLTK